MPFDIRNFDANASGSLGGVASHTYVNTGDTLATIRASGYFDAINLTLKTNDVIFIVGSDGAGFSRMDVTAGVVTVVDSSANFA